MYKHTLWESPSGTEAYVDLIGSKAGKCISSQPFLAALAKQALLNSLPLTPDTTYIEYDFKRDIGNTYVVETKDSDTVFYAKTGKSGLHKRYVRNRQPDSTSHITIMLHKDSDGNYEVTDLWLGMFIPELPDSSQPDPAAYEYWNTHAEIVDLSSIQISSITHECPYSKPTFS